MVDSSISILTNINEDNWCNWSPNGKYIAYSNTICDPECGIAIYNLEDNTNKIIAQYGMYASWNEKSDKIYYSHNYYIIHPMVKETIKVLCLAGLT